MRPWLPPSWTPFTGPSTSNCGMCGAPLDPKGKSPDFCNASCQDMWHQKQADPATWSSHLPADDHALSERIRSRLGLSGKDVA